MTVSTVVASQQMTLRIIKLEFRPAWKTCSGYASDDTDLDASRCKLSTPAPKSACPVLWRKPLLKFLLTCPASVLGFHSTSPCWQHAMGTSRLLQVATAAPSLDQVSALARCWRACSVSTQLYTAVAQPRRSMTS